QPEIRKIIANWDDQARRLVAHLRAEIDRAPQDQVLADLRRYLEAESPDFRALWQAKLGVPAPIKVFLHPRVGRLVFEVESGASRGFAPASTCRGRETAPAAGWHSCCACIVSTRATAGAALIRRWCAW